MNANPRFRQYRAYKIGILIGIFVLGILVLPEYDNLHASGPMNTGHDALKCVSCHEKARGTLRQQIQANLRFILGRRENSADFVHFPVGNEQCLGCHVRPNDRHPVYRFLEPRFAKARANLSPHLCISCHAEHSGRRVSLTKIEYCQNCHKKTRLRKDPLDVTHVKLIELKLWSSCLGCHDFHGNHIMETPKKIKQIIPGEKIIAYFEGGSSPYGDKLRYKAKKEGDKNGR